MRQKVVYREGEGQPVRAITGEVQILGIFVKVTNEHGSMMINQANVITIKNAM